jgi:oligopeptide/dipeptide ABC transporter ATP-binding protein
MPGPRMTRDPAAEQLLAVQDLRVEFPAREGTAAVRGVSLSLRAGRTLGIAGESGSGKTTTALAAMGLLPPKTRVSGSIRTGDRELVGLPEKEYRRVRGKQIAMIFQETSTALNPVLKVGDQLRMATRAHFKGSKEDVEARIISALRSVRLTDYDRVLRSYAHELSGGMCQRIIIAMALSCGSRILLADEPTTALDVSIQEEILALLRTVVAERQLGLMLISHDLAFLADLCDDLVVMYKGEIVEAGSARSVIATPAHPYTRALLDCIPSLHTRRDTLPELRDFEPPGAPGCAFRHRCEWRADPCLEPPALEAVGETGERSARCWRSAEVAGEHAAASGSTV